MQSGKHAAPSELLALQHSFVESIISHSPFELSQIQPVGSLSATEALAVYQGDYRARLTEALADTYLSVAEVLGSDFEPLCQDYLAIERSQSTDLQDFGNTFPDFLRQSACLQTWPFLAELAEVDLCSEWLFFQHATPLPDQSCLTELDENADIRLCFVPHCQIFVSEYPLFSLWRQRFVSEKALLQRPENLLLFKNQAGIQGHRLSAEQTSLFLALQAGSSLGQVFAEETSLSPEEVSAFFGWLYHAGLIAAFALSGQTEAGSTSFNKKA
ncbi:MAG: putative DNA-binding domain-containing protein [Candidatus Sericytochromatia bacterium]|nr:putative DNA-binding domain-containing protein [Candidatus Sericytochromatia bacterium]